MAFGMYGEMIIPENHHTPQSDGKFFGRHHPPRFSGLLDPFLPRFSGPRTPQPPTWIAINNVLESLNLIYSQLMTKTENHLQMNHFFFTLLHHGYDGSYGGKLKTYQVRKVLSKRLLLFFLGWGVLLMMDYTGKLCPKGVPFSG